jgi:hypothetical protein
VPKGEEEFAEHRIGNRDSGQGSDELHGHVEKRVPSSDATLPGLGERHDGIEVGAQAFSSRVAQPRLAFQ